MVEKRIVSVGIVFKIVSVESICYRHTLIGFKTYLCTDGSNDIQSDICVLFELDGVILAFTDDDLQIAQLNILGYFKAEGEDAMVRMDVAQASRPVWYMDAKAVVPADSEGDVEEVVHVRVPVAKLRRDSADIVNIPVTYVAPLFSHAVHEMYVVKWKQVSMSLPQYRST